MYDIERQLEVMGSGFFTILSAIAKLDARFDEIERKLNHLHQMENRIMTDLTEITAQVSANSDAEQSAIVLLNDLSARIAAAATDPVALAELSDQLRTNAADLAAAVVANTPVTVDVPPVDVPPVDVPPVDSPPVQI